MVVDELNAKILFEEIQELVNADKQGDELASKYIEAGKLVVDEDPNLAVKFYEKALKVVGVSKKLKMGLLGDIAYAYESLGETEKADNYIEAAKLSMHSGRSD